MIESNDLLFMLYLEHNDDAYNELYKRHLRIIKKIIKKYSYVTNYLSCDYNDLYLECNLSYILALKNYSYNSDICIDTYIYKCIENSLIDYIRIIKRKPLEQTNIMSNDEDMFEKILFVREQPEDFIIKEELINEINELLSFKEKEIFMNIINGKPYMEISDEMNISKKQLYNSVTRIRNKAKIILEK